MTALLFWNNAKHFFPITYIVTQIVCSGFLSEVCTQGHQVTPPADIVRNLHVDNYGSKHQVRRKIFHALHSIERAMTCKHLCCNGSIYINASFVPCQNKYWLIYGLTFILLQQEPLHADG
jgi:hypothetical protein